jgi:hypothetical protein
MAIAAMSPVSLLRIISPSCEKVGVRSAANAVQSNTWAKPRPEMPAFGGTEGTNSRSRWGIPAPNRTVNL